MYFMNSGTHKFFGTITFRIRYIFAACTGLYKFARLIAFITLYLVMVNILNILHFFLDSLTNTSTTTGAGTGIVDCIKVVLYWGS
jgi:hypothetical protein